MRKGSRKNRNCAGFVERLESRLMLTTVNGSNSSDATYTSANTWVWTPITISGVPAGSVMNSVTVSWNVDSNFTSDIDWYAENFGLWTSSTFSDMAKTGDDFLDGYSETSA